MNDSTVPNDSSEVAEAPAPITASSPPNFVSVQLKGVGGWLLFFVIGQLTLRPMMFLRNLGQGQGVNTAEIAERFPTTAAIIKIETAVQVGLLIAGIVVGCSLLRTGVTWPVLLARLFLIANALLTLALAVLYFNNDLPESARSSLIVEGFVTGVGVSIVSFVWFLYFMRSKRVQATYFGKVA